MITSFTYQLIPGGVILHWTSDVADATFRLYRDGVLLVTTKLTEWTVPVDDGASPIFEVFDDATTPPTKVWPDHVRLEWEAVQDRYRVEQYVGSSWVAVATISRGTRTYLTWSSGRLADVTSHQFRVIAIHVSGYEGSPVNRTVLMVRTPDGPVTTWTYSAVNKKATVLVA